MNRQEYDRAAKFWISRESEIKQMEPKQLLSKIEEFLTSHNTCALATGSGSFVRCTPLEYEYFRGRLWIITEGGLKFAALRDNDRVSVAVYEPYTDFDSVKGIQITGTAQVAEPGNVEFEEYQAHRSEKGGSGAALPQGLYLLVIHPERIEGVFGEFLGMGYSARQKLTLREPIANSASDGSLPVNFASAPD